MVSGAGYSEKGVGEEGRDGGWVGGEEELGPDGIKRYGGKTEGKNLKEAEQCVQKQGWGPGLGHSYNPSTEKLSCTSQPEPCETLTQRKE